MDLTITGVGSEESILRDDVNGTPGHPLGAIRRTDNVTVEYERRMTDHDQAGIRREERGSW